MEQDELAAGAEGAKKHLMYEQYMLHVRTLTVRTCQVRTKRVRTKRWWETDVTQTQIRYGPAWGNTTSVSGPTKKGGQATGIAFTFKKNTISDILRGEEEDGGSGFRDATTNFPRSSRG